MKNVKTYLAVAVFVIVGILSACNAKEEEILLEKEPIEEQSNLEAEIETKAEENSLDSERIYVHICGAVMKPGVFELDEGTRLYEAIETAGGVTLEADLESINLVDILTDGEQVRIPSVGEQNEEDSLININSADVSMLCQIPGIGQTRAQAIIDYRNTNGKFSCIEDLKLVSGIKDGLFEKIQPFITAK